MTTTFLILSPLFIAAAFLVYAVWADERDLRRIYKMFGTTGFYDVDDRFRRNRP